MDRKDILDVVMVVVEKANSIWPNLDLEIPTVGFFSRGTRAGTAWYKQNKVEFNEVLALENGDAFFNTCAHEVAHLVTHKLFPWAKAHGAEFKRVFMMLDGDGKRCHSYNVASVKTVKTVTRYVYACNCRNDILVTRNVHNKVTYGHKYRCRKCRGEISHTGRIVKKKGNLLQDVDF